MIAKRGLMLALAGAGLALQACSSPPPPPPAAPPPAPPAPDFSGTYTGKVTFARSCHGPSNATLTVQNKQFDLMWNKAMTFSGPVADDGSLSANIAGSPPARPPHHKRVNGLPGGDLTGKIDGGAFTGQVVIGRCTTPLMLTKST
jgi:hypothetical protein